MNRLQAVLTAMKNPNAYRQPDKPVVDWHAQLAEQVQRETTQLTALSQELVQDQRYGQLKQLYQRILASTLRLMIWYDVPTGYAGPRNDLYLERMRHFQEQLRVLTQIVEMPTEFAAKATNESSTPPSAATFGST